MISSRNAEISLTIGPQQYQATIAETREGFSCLCNDKQIENLLNESLRIETAGLGYDPDALATLAEILAKNFNGKVIKAPAPLEFKPNRVY